MSESNLRPTIDLGYPTEPYGRIPSFNSIEEEAAFWDTHDFTDFTELTEPFELTVGPELRRGRAVLPDAATDSEAEDASEGNA